MDTRTGATGADVAEVGSDLAGCGIVPHHPLGRTAWDSYCTGKANLLHSNGLGICTESAPSGMNPAMMWDRTGFIPSDVDDT